MAKSKRKLPNILMFLRLTLIFFMIIAFLVTDDKDVAGGLFLLAVLTCVADWIAQTKYTVPTRLEVFMRSVSEDFLYIAPLLCLVIARMVNWYLLVLLVVVDIIREFLDYTLTSVNKKKFSKIYSGFRYGETVLVWTGILFSFWPDIFAPYNTYILHAAVIVYFLQIIVDVIAYYMKIHGRGFAEIPPKEEEAEEVETELQSEIEASDSRQTDIFE